MKVNAKCGKSKGCAVEYDLPDDGKLIAISSILHETAKRVRAVRLTNRMALANKLEKKRSLEKVLA